MSSFNIKIELSKLNGFCFSRDKKYAIIPIEENDIYVSSSNSVYMNMTALELPEEKYGQDYIIQLKLFKETYGRLTREQKAKIPIIGGMRKREERKKEKKEPKVRGPKDFKY